MSVSIDTSLESWARGGEKFEGQRLLPHVIDFHAHENPSRVFAAVPKTQNVADGFRDVDMKTMATAVDSMAWWLDNNFKNIPQGNKVLAYVGVPDVRYPILFFAAIKARWTTMWVSPRNPPNQNANLLRDAGVNILLYADIMEPVAKGLKELCSQSLISSPVPSLDDVLSGKSATYPFDVLFEDIKDEKCLALHSSGSTGHPKIVYYTHAAFSCTDADSNVPVPEGRRPQNAKQFDFSPAGRFYSCFPPFHLAGVMAFTILPTFSTTTAAVWGPSTKPPSGHLVSSIMDQMTIRALYLPPSIIEQWTCEPGAYKQAESLDFVLFGGGPLAPGVGQKLNEFADVCQMYGSLEIGQVQMLIAQPGEWQYLEPNPAEECDMQEVEEGAGIYELVLHQDDKFKGRRTVSHTFPGVEEWRTKDLFTPHPTKKGLWQFHSRIDDVIVLGSSYKVFPVPMESALQADPNIAGALIIGNGRPAVALIVEPRQSMDGVSKEEFIDKIWPSIVEANAATASYGQIQRSRVILTDPAVGFARTPKGTISRKPSEGLYAVAIDAVYGDDIAADDSSAGALKNVGIDETKNFIRSAIRDIRPDSEKLLSDDDDFFARQAMDSLNMLELAQKLRLGMANSISKDANTLSIWGRAIQGNPTMNSLSKAVLSMRFDGQLDSKEAITPDTLVQDLTAKLPERNMKIEPSSSTGQNIVLLGARGRLGPFLVKTLLESPRVASLKCLDRARGNTPADAFQQRANELGLSVDTNDSRLQFIPIDLSKPNLELPQDQLDDILKSSNVIIHNIWAVNFSFSLQSFQPEMLKSLSSIIEIANNASSRPRLLFSSTTGTVQDWASRISPNIPVPEEVIRCPDLAALTGYAQSKHVAERLLENAGKKLQIPISILRIGLIGGPSTGPVKWESKDVLHSLSILSKASNLVPNDMGEVDCIPVDIVSRILRDLALDGNHGAGTELYNLVHPKPVPFAMFADALQSCIPSSKQVGFEEWVDHLAKLPENALPKHAEIEKVRILPFFQGLKAILYEPVLRFETKKAQRISEYMANMEPLDKDMLSRWCVQWI